MLEELHRLTPKDPPTATQRAPSGPAPGQPPAMLMVNCPCFNVCLLMSNPADCPSSTIFFLVADLVTLVNEDSQMHLSNSVPEAFACVCDCCSLCLVQLCFVQ